MKNEQERYICSYIIKINNFFFLLRLSYIYTYLNKVYIHLTQDIN